MEPSPSELAEKVNSLMKVGESVLTMLEVPVRFGLDHSAAYTPAFEWAVEPPGNQGTPQADAMLVVNQVVELPSCPSEGSSTAGKAPIQLEVPCWKPGVGSG